MSKGVKYLLVSLPTNITLANEHDEALTALRSAVTTDNGTTVPFKIPEFKIGTLDALVNQADELAKLESGCEGVVSKVGDSLRTILEGDDEKIAQQKTVNDKPVDQYLKSFSWNKVKYRADRPLGELIDMLQKEITSIDNDVKNKYNQYNQVKTSLTVLQRKQTGNLSNKSLTTVVDPSLVIRDSEYLETHLIAVPNTITKDFIKSYETLCQFIVPRSAIQIDSDEEFTLYAVTTFKKTSQDFIHKCREHKWTPRDFKYKEGGREEEQKEVDKVAKDEKKVWGEALRLGRTAWGEAVMAWVHVLALRVFVETVLRYGLPLSFVCGLVRTTPKLMKRVRGSLDNSYSYLAGNAFGRDKKGRVTKDDSAMSADMQAAGNTGDGADYSAYVCYEFEIN
ncbi:MAG: Vacuolar ATP synthase subunit C [Heterodermia speciosa]|uniref:V-type proton ATPase subunit C n=1 Tax=Heterodermia speciosa TaxID=116794 RepID=A0A8H3ERI4_9LECA|nr:MAG: Vacuolar ATP synthase subunit C [Heterodermia speciosa]